MLLCVFWLVFYYSLYNSVAVSLGLVWDLRFSCVSIVVVYVVSCDDLLCTFIGCVLMVGFCIWVVCLEF